MLILLFMAVTSSTSAELIAVSSLLTFDVYKTYIKPDSTSHRLVQVSHYGIVIYATVLAAFCCILNAVGLNLTWLLTVLGIIVGGGAVPVGLVLLWPGLSHIAACATPYCGLTSGLIAWFVTTKLRSGAINVTTTGDTINAVAGNIASSCGGLVAAFVLSFVFPGKHVSTDPKHVERYNKIQGISTTPTSNGAGKSPASGIAEAEKDGAVTDVAPEHDKELDAVTSSPVENTVETSQEPKSAPQPESYVPTGNELVDYLETKQFEPMDPVMTKRAMKIATLLNWVFLLVAMILVPFTLFGVKWICKSTPALLGHEIADR